MHYFKGHDPRYQTEPIKNVKKYKGIKTNLKKIVKLNRFVHQSDFVFFFKLKNVAK